jgi:DNA-binding transcriptional MerR regulator
VLTISQLASYAGVTVRAVRHYHQVGLLPEPERDRSGYRTYGATDVIRLIRVRTLAEAGVPLARVQELLEASAAEFAVAVAQIDAELRTKVRELQEHRRRIARLADGDALAVPPEVRSYLDRLREVGASAGMVEGERDGWILMAARWPERIGEFMADKNAQLDDPRTVRLYLLLDGLVASDGPVDEAALVEAADLMVELTEEARADPGLDDPFVDLVDAFATGAHPVVGRLQELLAERGWTGWAHLERLR